MTCLFPGSKRPTGMTSEGNTFVPNISINNSGWRLQQNEEIARSRDHKGLMCETGLTYFFFPNEAVLLLSKMHLVEENGCSIPSIAHVKCRSEKQSTKASISDAFTTGDQAPSQGEA